MDSIISDLTWINQIKKKLFAYGMFLLNLLQQELYLITKENKC